MPLENRHHVLGGQLQPPFPEGSELALFGLGCFWGAERKFWQLPGVYSTSVGYTGGVTPNPTYREVCSGMTGHNEVVRLVFDPKRVSTTARCCGCSGKVTIRRKACAKGNDVGTQYRSGVYCTSAEQARASGGLAHRLRASAARQGGCEPITTEVIAAPEFYYAEGYHQQYLSEEPTQELLRSRRHRRGELRDLSGGRVSGAGAPAGSRGPRRPGLPGETAAARC